MRRSGGAYQTKKNQLYLLCFLQIMIEAEFWVAFSSTFSLIILWFLLEIYSFDMELIVFYIFAKSAGAYYVIELLAHQTSKM